MRVHKCDACKAELTSADYNIAGNFKVTRRIFSWGDTWRGRIDICAGCLAGLKVVWLKSHGHDPMTDGHVAGLGEAIGLIHAIKNELYDGENDLLKKFCVRLENAILTRIADVRSTGTR